VFVFPSNPLLSGPVGRRYKQGIRLPPSVGAKGQAFGPKIAGYGGNFCKINDVMPSAL